MLLRSLRFLEINTCEVTEELGGFNTDGYNNYGYNTDGYNTDAAFC
jgi:hypothetical protein